jgi:hypothetical protein
VWIYMDCYAMSVCLWNSGVCGLSAISSWCSLFGITGFLCGAHGFYVFYLYTFDYGFMPYFKRTCNRKLWCSFSFTNENKA